MCVRKVLVGSKGQNLLFPIAQKILGFAGLVCVRYSVPDENCKITFNIVTVCFMWQLKPDKQAQIRKVYEIHVAGMGNNITLTVFSSELMQAPLSHHSGD